MIKRISFVMAMCLSSFYTAYAQPVMSYVFESKTDEYVAIENGTELQIESGDGINNKFYSGDLTSKEEKNTSAGFPIGFDFVYNNTVMNRFAIGSHMYLVLGKDEVTVDPSAPKMLLANSGEGRNNIVQVAPNSDIFGLETTSISYKLSGSAPYRVMTVQYKQLGVKTSMWDDTCAPVNLQIKLYETYNRIDMVFNGWTDGIGTNSIFTRIGIKGTGSDLHQRYNGDGDWTATELSTVDMVVRWTNASKIADGLTFSFTACADCVVPANIAGELEVKGNTSSVEGSFKATDDADTYLVLISEEELSELPVEGIMYKRGDLLGNATVAGFGPETSFSYSDGISGGKLYNIYVIGANSYCMFGPKYNTTAYLKGTVQTAPKSPVSIVATQNEYGKAVLNVVANDNSDRVIIAVTEEYSLDSNNNILPDGKFGNPAADNKPGDKLEGGGIVVYVGEASGAITVDGLKDNTLYRFKAWSLNGNSECSTDGVNGNILTWGVVPYYPDFSQMPRTKAPFGWDSEGDFRISYVNSSESYQLECNLSTVNSVTGSENTLVTPWVKLSDGTNRIVFDMNMNVYGRIGNTLYAWGEDDLFEILVSKDGENYESVYMIDHTCVPVQQTAASFTRIYVPFEKYSGEKVKIKIKLHVYKSVRTYLMNLFVEQKEACDYPISLDVPANSVAGDEAVISWVAQGEETAWEVRYCVSGSDAWCAPIETSVNPLKLSGLPSETDMDIQVRAKCGISTVSRWSDTYKFRTGYMIPFTLTYPSTVQPTGFAFENGVLATPTEFCASSCKYLWRWTSAASTRGFNVYGTTASSDWLLMPVLNFGDGKANYVLDFELTANTTKESDEVYYIVASKDGGLTYNESDVVYKIETADLPNKTTGDAVKSYVVPLKGFRGNVRLAVYAQSTKAPSNIRLSKFSVEPTCPMDVVTVLSDITSSEAKISWTGLSEEWLYFIREQGSEERKFTVTDRTDVVLKGLSPRTAYEFGITKSCAEGDTARVVVTPFTTLAFDPCAGVENIVVIPAQYSAMISWDGDAVSYNVRYREQGGEAWSSKTVTDGYIYIDGLEPEKGYEYCVQSVCSGAEGDNSEWSEAAAFTTPAVTCFVPENITVTVTHRSAVVSWEGLADKYEISMPATETEWTTVVVEGKSYEYTGLTAETAYSFRVRSFCAENDMSQWSSVTSFTTASVPQCVVPYDLEAFVPEGSAGVMLQWKSDESNLSWNIRYRAGTVTSWTTENDIAQCSYLLSTLEKNTTYLWSVRATCDEERTSNWATQKQFVTTSVNKVSASDMKVFVSGNILNVINKESDLIHTIYIYNTNGQLMKVFGIESDENVLIPLELFAGQIIVRVEAYNSVNSYTLTVR